MPLFSSSGSFTVVVVKGGQILVPVVVSGIVFWAVSGVHGRLLWFCAEVSAVLLVVVVLLVISPVFFGVVVP